MKVSDLRDLLLHYAMHAQHVRVTNKEQDVHAGHVVQATTFASAPGGWMRHEVSLVLPVGYPHVDALAEQMMLFDWLCESFGEDASLVDHFATRLIERLRDLEVSHVKP